MLVERPSAVAGGVLWTRTPTAQGAEYRIVPDGCMDLIWWDGGLIVAGPDTEPHVATSRRGGTTFGLRFAPGTGPAALGVPARPLRDQRVPLDAIWPVNEARGLGERIAEAASPGRALEAAALRLYRARPSDPQILAIVAPLRSGRSVAAVAEAVGLSERQLHRRCLAAFGYGPKTLARVLRFHRALSLASSGTPHATAAATAGYADQSHLARDVKALTGVPLSTLLNGVKE